MKNARDQQSLATESKIMLKLRKKPFILQLYESFSNHRYVFMVLDLAELGDLNGLIKKVGVSVKFHSQYRSSHLLITHSLLSSPQ